MADDAQLSIFEVINPETSTEHVIDTDRLFEPDGGQRCEHCRRRLAWFGGRLWCVSPYCQGEVSR